MVSRWLSIGAWLRTTEGEREITDILKAKLDPTYLDVRDISGEEKCYSFYTYNLSLGGCGSMYQITIDSDSFRDKRIIDKHRMINQALGQDIIKALHGLTIRIGNNSS